MVRPRKDDQLVNTADNSINLTILENSFLENGLNTFSTNYHNLMSASLSPVLYLQSTPFVLFHLKIL